VSIAERRHNSCRLLRRVYDDHQPTGGSDIPLEEPLPPRPRLSFPMVRRLDRVEHSLQVELKLGMAIQRFKMCSSHVSDDFGPRFARATKKDG
jgi:hypothetical protein